MSEHTDRLLYDIEKLAQANVRLRQELIKHHKVLARNIAQIEAGKWTHSTQHPETAELRAELTEVFDAFTDARHAVRLDLFAVGADQGLSAGAIARTLGISRQLGAKLTTEANKRGH